MFENKTKEDIVILGMMTSFMIMFGIWIFKYYNQTLIILSLFPLLISFVIAFVFRRE